MTLRDLWIPATIALVAVGLRVLALARMIEPPHLLHNDPEFYTKITAGLLEGRWAGDVWIFPPGFPLLSLPLALVLGPGWGIIVTSALAGIALPLLLLGLALVVSRPERAVVAALIVAVFPEAILSTGRALSEAPTLLLLVGMVVLFEASERMKVAGKRRLCALAAGVAGGLCVLTRPETIATVLLLGALGALFPSHEPRRRSWESTALFAGAVVLVMMPYLTALHDRAGVWALSLKPHFNIKKAHVQSFATTFVERRTFWDDYQREKLIVDGEFDPRRIAEGVSLKNQFLRREMVPVYFGSMKKGFERGSLLEKGLIVLGVAGLLAAMRESKLEKREAALAAISGAGLLTVPLLFIPVDRYALIALPALAWGTAAFLEACWRWGRLRMQRRFADALALVTGCAIVAAGTIGVEEESRDYHWRARELEFQAAMHRGDLDTAALLVDEGLEADPENSGVRAARKAVSAAMEERAETAPTPEAGSTDLGR